MHYPSDVLAGAVWGGLVAGVVLLTYRPVARRIRRFSLPLW